MLFEKSYDLFQNYFTLSQISTEVCPTTFQIQHINHDVGLWILGREYAEERKTEKKEKQK